MSTPQLSLVQIKVLRQAALPPKQRYWTGPWTGPGRRTLRALERAGLIRIEDGKPFEITDAGREELRKIDTLLNELEA